MAASVANWEEGGHTSGVSAITEGGYGRVTTIGNERVLGIKTLRKEGKGQV